MNRNITMIEIRVIYLEKSRKEDVKTNVQFSNNIIIVIIIITSLKKNSSLSRNEGMEI